MAYLLNYKKWEKLYESKKLGRYGSLYEQAFNSETTVNFVLVGGTSPLIINDKSLHEKTDLPDGEGISLYEISMTDLLSNSFQKARKIKSLDTNNQSDYDRFQILDENNKILMEIKGKGEILFTYDPKSKAKIRFSGNGVLSAYRAVSKFAELQKFTELLTLENKGNIKLYMNSDSAPVRLATTNKFEIGVTNLGSKIESISSQAGNLVVAALHYLVNDENEKKFIVSKYPDAFTSLVKTSIYPIGSGVSEKRYDGTTLKAESISYLTPDGGFVGTRTDYTELDSFKSNSSSDLLTQGTGPGLFLKPEIREAIIKYVNTNFTNFAKDGGTINQYYNQKLEGLGDDLINSLLGVKTFAKQRVDALIKSSSTTMYNIGDFTSTAFRLKETKDSTRTKVGNVQTPQASTSFKEEGGVTPKNK